MKRTKGFTLVELLVVVAIIALLVSILLPALGRAKDAAKRVICTANLNSISKGWMMYTNENNGRPPILPDIDQGSSSGDAIDCWEDLKMGDECQAYGSDGLGVGAQQNLCLLVKIGTVPWGMFICPASGNKKASRGSGQKYGMGEVVASGAKKNYCDYAIQVPYLWATGESKVNKCPLDQNMDSRVVILGDKSPLNYSEDANSYLVEDEWSPNHPNDGESILYAAGNVRFSKDEGGDPSGNPPMKNTSGYDGDCIYTNSGTIGDISAWAFWDNKVYATRRAFWSGDTNLYWWGY